MQTTADYRRRPLGSSSWRVASTSSQAWGLGAVGAGTPGAGKHTADTVGSYGASKSMKLQWRAAVMLISRADGAKIVLGGAETSLEECGVSWPDLATYTPC
jgi:hypothetical protein